MSAIFDFMLRMTSESVYISLVVLPDPEDMGLPLEFLCYHAHMLRFTLFRMLFRFIAAIFYWSLTQTSDSFQTCRTVLLELKTVTIGLRGVLLSYTTRHTSVS